MSGSAAQIDLPPVDAMLHPLPGGVVYDRVAGGLRYRGAVAPLRPQAAFMLSVLALRPGCVLTYRQILGERTTVELAFASDIAPAGLRVTAAAVRTAIRALDAPFELRTVYRLGYGLFVMESAPACGPAAPEASVAAGPHGSPCGLDVSSLTSPAAAMSPALFGEEQQ